LGGLPRYLTEMRQVPSIDFDPYAIDELKIGLSTVMPSFREWIETKRIQEFQEALGKLSSVD